MLSLDDFVITNFVGGAVNTFPTWVYGRPIGVPPQVNVWGTILFMAGLITAGLNLVASFRSSRKAAEGEVVGPGRPWVPGNEDLLTDVRRVGQTP